ncbi:trihelix transcription factor PTL-like [Lycium barbarum]|uniref:trihelix transcription factor PTL-like n=1 Tax=Lycium barbarum TaxID=112863 RepID=UPI00293E9736|nr:trihelix transcription factor PTL-like [Lycium barbarum]
MDDHQYGMMDLTQYMNGRPLFATVPPHLTPDYLCGQHQHFEMVMPSTTTTVPQHDNFPPPPPHHHHEFLCDSSTMAAATTRASVSSGGGGGCTLSALEGGSHGRDGGNGRWPRQETLTLLEVRSRLDSKFKEANQKGPLWDEVSRIMSEEYGYQRKGKKCKEKFENLYKYYKKTKEGKAGRQDGKHYRYFRQLEALYGKTSNTISEINHVNTTLHYHQEAHNFHHHQGPKLSDSLIYSLSDSSDSDATNSSDDSNMENDSKGKRKNKRRGKRSWKAKIRDFVDIQMKKLMEKQEVWLEKMMKTIEDKEQERILREDEWRKKQAIRIEKEQKFWANERAGIEARDAALIDALHKLNGEDKLMKSSNNINDKNGSMFFCSKKQKDMNSLSSCYYNFQKNEEGRLSYCETSRHVSNVHETIDDGLF